MITKCSKYDYYYNQNSNGSALGTTNMSNFNNDYAYNSAHNNSYVTNSTDYNSTDWYSYYYDYIYPNQTQYLKLAEFLANFTNTRNQFEIKHWFLVWNHYVSCIKRLFPQGTKPRRQECSSKYFVTDFCRTQFCQ